MLYLTRHYIDLCEPTVLCLSALSGSVENKTNLELHACFLVFSWSIISRSFLLYREKPLFCPSSLKSGVWRAAKLLCRGVPSAFKTVHIESCRFTWRTAAQESLRVWTMPSSWLHQPSRKLRDLGMLKTWLLITEAGGRGTMTFKRRLKGGVLILKKLLQKSTKFFFLLLTFFFTRGYPFTSTALWPPEDLFSSPTPFLLFHLLAGEWKVLHMVSVPSTSAVKQLWPVPAAATVPVPTRPSQKPPKKHVGWLCSGFFCLFVWVFLKGSRLGHKSVWFSSSAEYRLEHYSTTTLYRRSVTETRFQHSH